MYEILFRNYYNYFHNLDIILLVLNNFKNKIIKFIRKLSTKWNDYSIRFGLF